MSGGGPSSIKQYTQCAARVPVLSRGCEDRVEVIFDFGVYGLVLQFGAVFLCPTKGASQRDIVRLLQKRQRYSSAVLYYQGTPVLENDEFGYGRLLKLFCDFRLR